MIVYIYIFTIYITTYSLAQPTDENFTNENDETEWNGYEEPIVNPRIVNIDLVGTTQSPAKFKNYYRRKAIIELKRKFPVSRTFEPTPMSNTDEKDPELEKNYFGVDSEIYLCKKSPGKKTSESRLCQIDNKPKCQCVASDCEFFQTFSKKKIYKCVVRRK